MSRVGPLRFIEPQLASPVEQPPEGQHWITKLNVTAFAAKLLIEHRGAHVFTRNGYDWSDRYPSIARAASSFRCQSAVIVVRPLCRTVTELLISDSLNSAMRWRPESIILYAFDLMHLDGKNFRQRALSDRRSILKVLLRSDEESHIQFSEEFVGDGAAFFKACADNGLEGIVSKHRLAPYRSGRKNLANDQVLHRIHLCRDRHRPRPQDRSA